MNNYFLHNKYLYSIVQVPSDSGVPDNIYTGGIYYKRTECNIWEMTFMVVQNVKVFLEVI